MNSAASPSVISAIRLMPMWVKGLLDHLAHLVGGPLVARQLGRAPALRDVLHQVRGRDYLHAQAPHQLHRPGVHPGHPGKRPVGSVLHGNPLLAAQQPPQGGRHLLVAGERVDGKARTGEAAGVHVVRQQARAATARDQAPAWPRHVGHRAQDLPEEGIQAAVVIEEPGVGGAGGPAEEGLGLGNEAGALGHGRLHEGPGLFLCPSWIGVEAGQPAMVVRGLRTT